MKPYWQQDGNEIYQGHVLDVLKGLPDESVHCIVTSPPYWGLRDYGIEGQLGLEKTPEEYIEKMVEIFREVRRVLRSDGTLFLNLGDSYMGSGGAHKEHHANPGLSKSFERGGVPHANLCGTSDKAPVNYQDHGCLCENLCDVCREVYRNHRFHNDNLLVSMLIASLFLPNLENKGFESGHSPTLDFSHLESHILNAIRDYGNFVFLSDEQISSFLESMPDEFSRQLLDECWQRGNRGECLFCGRSLISDASPFSCKLGESLKTSDYTRGNALFAAEQDNHNQNKNRVCEYCSVSFKPQSTVNNKLSQQLKPKDLCGIPWRVALALQADGWWLRSDIIWHKPNPMPESVTDRPTKAHEYMFLLTKSAKYFYDAEAVREKHQPDGRKVTTTTIGPGAHKNHCGSAGHERWPNSGRNKRTVWTIPTKPFPQAHFATFPPALVEPCILAGTSEKGCCAECGAPWERIIEKGELVPDNPNYKPRGNKRGDGFVKNAMTPSGETQGHPNFHYEKKTIGWQPTCKCNAGKKPCVVLDPFLGSGTTAMVAYKHDRKFIGIELSKPYLDDIAIPRIEKETRQLKLFN